MVAVGTPKTVRLYHDSRLTALTSWALPLEDARSIRPIAVMAFLALDNIHVLIMIGAGSVRFLQDPLAVLVCISDVSCLHLIPSNVTPHLRFASCGQNVKVQGIVRTQYL